jgi:two-component sensor histidine kinase
MTPDQVGFAGADVALSPNATLHVGLALHELCVASVRFGALAGDDGRAVVTSEALGDGRLHLTWSEAGGTPRDIERFARLLLERIVPAAVGGTATITAEGGEWHYDLVLAAEEFDAIR